MPASRSGLHHVPSNSMCIVLRQPSWNCKGTAYCSREKDGRLIAYTAVTADPMPLAISIAHCSAACESGEPSSPTTIRSIVLLLGISTLLFASDAACRGSEGSLFVDVGWRFFRPTLLSRGFGTRDQCCQLVWCR